MKKPLYPVIAQKSLRIEEAKSPASAFEEIALKLTVL